jgi:hypothetical protein
MPSAFRNVSSAVCQSTDVAVTAASLLIAVTVIALLFFHSLCWLAPYAYPQHIPARDGQ